MERLNQIMGRTVPGAPRRQTTKLVPTALEATGRSVPSSPAKPEHLVQQPPGGPLTCYPASYAPGYPASSSPRSLPEQTPRLGQKYPYGSSQNLRPAAPRTRPSPYAEEQRERGYPPASGAPSRQLYQRPQPRHPYSNSGQNRPDEQGDYAHDRYNSAPRAHRTEDYGHTLHPTQTPPFASPPTLRADALPVWETEDEEPGMRYDDWESDEPIVYQRADVEIVSNPYANYSSRHPVYEPEHNVIEQKGHPTPERYAHPTPATPVPTPAQPAQPAYESAREQRMTQPLKPKSNGGAGAEYEQGGPTVPQTPQPSSPRPTRQLTPAPREANEVKRRLATVRTPCPYCKGAGYLRANVPFGHPQFGKPQPCVCKEQEKREKRRQQLLELSDLRAFRNRSFSNFNTRFQGMHPSVQEAFDAAYSFAQNPNGWLLLVGPNGCGKTHLAAAIANHCLSEGEIVLFSVVPELLDHLRAAFAPSSSEVYDQLFARMREAGLLVLDDLGAHYGTPWAAEKLFQLLNYRYNWRMPTVITSNVPGLQSLDIRLRSRMADNSLVVTINLERARDCRPYLIRQEP